MKILSNNIPLAEQTSDALILFFQNEKNLTPSLSAELTSQLQSAVKHSAFKGAAGQTALFLIENKQVIVTGLGASEDFYNGLLEQAAATAVRAGIAAGAHSFAMSSTIEMPALTQSDYLRIAGRGAAWGSYEFSTFKSKQDDRPVASLVFAGAISDEEAIKDAQAQGEALLSTADLANLPGNKATPSAIAEWAQNMAQETGLSCEIIHKDELMRKKCGGILSVAAGSAQDPNMIILKHEGSTPGQKPIILVGKTVTFDSGGISLKQSKGMGWMRYDKCGGMAVLTAMQMIAKMNVKVPVIGILGVAENMPGSNATRPGDIITAYNGKTIEVLNTDAEGRLVLADALGIAGEFEPAAIVDLATLTGAVIGALGSSAAAILGNQPEIIKAITQAGETAGERLWNLPLYKEYTDDMKSDFADLSNICKSGGAGTATAAAFLKEFVPENTPWAHIDIAGVAWLESAKPYQAAGVTLFGARLLAQWVSEMS